MQHAQLATTSIMVGFLLSCIYLAIPAFGQGGVEAGMSPSKILVQQMSWHQAQRAHDWFRGINIWTPLDASAGRWTCWQFRGHDSARDGVPATEALATFACDMRNGMYYRAKGDKVTTSGPVGVSGGMWASFWSLDNKGGVTFTIKNGSASATDLWLLGFPHTSSGSASITASAGEVVLESVDFRPGKTWHALSQQDVMMSFVRVASGLSDGDKVTVRCTGPGNVRIIGAIAVGKTSADPSTGVFDPSSIVRVMTRKPQPAANPTKFRIGGGPPRFFGLGHWTTDYSAKFDAGTLGDSSETLFYNVNLPWNPAAGAWVDQEAFTFSRHLVGVVRCADEGSLTDLGHYRETIMADAGGTSYDWQITWNDNAQSNNVRVVPEGYCGQWSLDIAFNQARILPTQNSLEDISITASGNKYLALPGTMIICRNPQAGLLAGIIPSSSYGAGDLWIWDYPSDGGFPKIYCRQMPLGTTHHVKAGETTGGGHRRFVLPERAFDGIRE